MLFRLESYYPEIIDELTLNGDDDLYTVTEFEHGMEMRQTSLSKTQRPGQWPTRQKPDHRKLLIAGDIKGSTYDEYFAARIAMLRLVEPPEDFDDYFHMRVHFQPEDGIDWFYADVVIDDYQLPIRANYPSVNPYRLELRSADPYLRINDTIEVGTM